MKENDLFFEEKSVDTRFSLNEDGLTDFNTLRKWTKFVAIYQIILLTFNLFGAIALIIITTTDKASFKGYSTKTGILNLFIILAVLIPTIFLIKFSLSAKRALKTEKTNTFNNSISFLKKYFMSTGIIMIFSTLATLIIMGFLIAIQLKNGPLF